MCNNYFIKLEKGKCKLMVVTELHKRQIEWGLKQSLKSVIFGTTWIAFSKVLTVGFLLTYFLDS